jgi:hypothetical protein
MTIKWINCGSEAITTVYKESFFVIMPIEYASRWSEFRNFEEVDFGLLDNVQECMDEIREKIKHYELNKPSGVDAGKE